MSRRCSYAGIQQQQQSQLSLSATQHQNVIPTGHQEVKKPLSLESTRNAMYQRSLEVPSQRQPSRRTSRSNDSTVNDISCSQQSVLNGMDRFVKSVNNMDATVLVPSRLRDMELGGRISPPPHMQVEDLHAFFTMLNDVKNELLWGPDTGSLQFITGASAVGNAAFGSGSLRVPSVSTRLTHKRQPSNGSLGSAASDLETDNESVSDFSSDPVEQTLQLASAFRHHLQGLHAILHQFADVADYIAARYQEEVEPSP